MVCIAHLVVQVAEQQEVRGRRRAASKGQGFCLILLRLRRLDDQVVQTTREMSIPAPPDVASKLTQTAPIAAKLTNVPVSF